MGLQLKMLRLTLVLVLVASVGQINGVPLTREMENRLMAFRKMLEASENTEKPEGAGEGDAGAVAAGEPCVPGDPGGGDPGVPMNSTAGDPSAAGEPTAGGHQNSSRVGCPPCCGGGGPTCGGPMADPPPVTENIRMRGAGEGDAGAVAAGDPKPPVLPIETTTVLPQEKVKSFRSGGPVDRFGNLDLTKQDPRIRMYRTIPARGFRSGKDSGMMNKLMESIMDQLEKGEPIKMVVDVKPQDVEGWLSKDQGSSNATIFPVSVDGSVQALNGTGPGTGSLGTRSLKSKNMEAMDDACCMAKWWHCCGK